MIKKGKFKNIFGIKELELDFTQKHVYNKEQYNQILKNGENCVSLIPTILAKNASGKTSLLKSIDFALRLSNRETFNSYVSNLRLKVILEKFRYEDKNLDITDEIMLTSRNYTQMLFERLFGQISFAGSGVSSIFLETIDGNTIKIEVTKESFVISINDNSINLINFIENITLSEKDIERPARVRKMISQITAEHSKTINFISEKRNFVSLFRDVKPSVELGEIAIKYKTRRYIKNLINTMGFKAVSVLLLKLDKNVTSINFDQDTNDYQIFIRNSEIPIAASNLSFGTQKVIEILNGSLQLFKSGGIMLIDEIENGLHPSLIGMITTFYEDDVVNKAGAQLLLTTHNPLLVENNIINKHNIFIYENNKFVTLKDLAKRTEDQKQFVKGKNYFNDIFWARKKLANKSTISSIATTQIIEEFQKGAQNY